MDQQRRCRFLLSATGIFITEQELPEDVRQFSICFNKLGDVTGFPFGDNRCKTEIKERIFAVTTVRKENKAVVS